MNELQIESLKSKMKSVNIYPILPIIEENRKIFLYHSTEENIDYSLYTDGNTEHLDTWLDKQPKDRDSFLVDYHLVNTYIHRFEFQITEASLILLEKKCQNKVVRELYINEEELYKIMNNQIYQVTITPKEHIKIKKMEKMKWK